MALTMVFWDVILCSLIHVTSILDEPLPAHSGSPFPYCTPHSHLGYFVDHEHGDGMFPQSVGTYLADYTESHPEDSLTCSINYLIKYLFI